jgi:hypothetical protein
VGDVDLDPVDPGSHPVTGASTTGVDMVGKSPLEQQLSRDVRRAESLVSRARGLSTDESARALRHRALTSGISLHAAALAVLSAPTDELLLGPPDRDRSERPAPVIHDRHPAMRDAR